MKKSFIIGIPIRDFENPMSRLSKIISRDERVNLSKGLLINLINVFSITKTDVFVISNDKNVKIFCEDNSFKIFKSSQNDLNKEIQEFLSQNDNYKNWSIVHGDLPYITKHFARIWINLCESSPILIGASKDNGTPIFGGSETYNNFLYGKNSFIKHTKIMEEDNIAYERVFHKELIFELDDEEDYSNFIKHQPRWYRKL